MRQRGTIRGWKDDKGFGFVTPAAGGEDAFVHINAFLNRQRRPVDGDEISYEAVQDFQQRWQAKAIRYADEPLPAAVVVESERSVPMARPSPQRSALPLLRGVLAILVLAILGLVGHQLWAGSAQASGSPQALLDESPADRTTVAAQSPDLARGGADPAIQAKPEPTSPQSDPNHESEDAPFRCDGRTRCPQMHSCEEANWFVANCPNTEMDGDGDGVACERQWCSGG